MTEQEIIKRLHLYLDDRLFPFQMSNSFIYEWECDYWAMTSKGITREFEIKVSRGDYFKDGGKGKHKSNTGANYFYYVCPKGMIAVHELRDARYGLIYVYPSGGIELVKKPRKLNDNIFSDWKMLANKFYWKFRNLWREKYIKKQITVDEYRDGFNLQLSEENGTDS